MHTMSIAGVNILRMNTINVGIHECPQIAHTRMQSKASIPREKTVKAKETTAHLHTRAESKSTIMHRGCRPPYS